MSRPAFLEVDGKRYLWRELLALRKEQLKAAAPAEQPFLFEVQTDVKPNYQKDIGRRYREPSLFDGLTR